MKITITFLMLFLGLYSLGQDSNNVDWLIGNWEGKGVQIDDATWEVNLTVESESSIRVSYPDLSCGGVWNRIEDDVVGIQYVESITLGLGNCDQGVEVTITKVDENTIELVYYFRVYDPVNPIAKAIMKRK